VSTRAGHERSRRPKQAHSRRLRRRSPWAGVGWTCESACLVSPGLQGPWVTARGRPDWLRCLSCVSGPDRAERAVGAKVLRWRDSYWLGGRDSVLARRAAGAPRHDHRTPCRASQTTKRSGGVWLGGRDSNPDNVVQSAVHGLRCVRFHAVSRGSANDHFGTLRSVAVRFCTTSLIVLQGATGMPPSTDGHPVPCGILMAGAHYSAV
jgi:hypothetical protein